MTEYHEIGFYGRANKAEQSFMVRKDYAKYDYTWVWVMIVGIFLASSFLWLLVGFLVPSTARAEQTGPRNNREVCEDIRDGKLFAPVGKLTDTVNLCAKLNVRI